MDTPPPSRRTPKGDSYALSANTVAAVLGAVHAGDRARLGAMLTPLHAADIADLLEQITEQDRQQLLALYGKDLGGDTLSELDEGLCKEVIAALPSETLCKAVRHLDSDDVVDLVAHVAPHQQEAILQHLPDVARVAVEQSLAYPEFSAGRLMQRESVAVPEHWSVGEVIDFMRNARDLPQQFYHVVLVDPGLHPVGQVRLGRIMSSKRPVRLMEIREAQFRTIPATQPQEDIAYAFNQYHLISVPVVDDDNRLVGVITIDDAMAALDEGHTQEILRLAGAGEGSLSERSLATTARRLPWLSVNLITAVMASWVIAQFEATIAQFVALAVLMPIVASMGGNAGTQSLTVAVRALATKDLTGRNIWRVLGRETLVGLINGGIFAVVMGGIGALWYHSPMLGAVIAAAMIINMAVAGLAGILIPVALEKIRVDPALASGAFVTTVTDVVGFFAFLALAAVALS